MPNRFQEFLETSSIDLENITFIIFDDTDKMIESNFETQIRKILDQIKSLKYAILPISIFIVT